MRPLQSELFNKIKEHSPLILLDPRFRDDDENVGLQQPHYHNFLFGSFLQKGMDDLIDDL